MLKFLSSSKMSRQLCFNTNTDQICLQVTPLSQVAAGQNGEVLQTQARGRSTAFSAPGVSGSLATGSTAFHGPAFQARQQTIIARCLQNPANQENVNVISSRIRDTTDTSFAFELLAELERQCQ